VVGVALAVGLAGAAPSRLGLLLALGLPVGLFLAPDVWLSRLARLRRAAILAALPDALDLLAVGAAGGRAPELILSELATQSEGQLARELRTLVAEIKCGASLSAALAALGRRVPAAEIRALAAALERSRTLGSPLADQLHEQAMSMRSEARRRLSERAARAAPKIQLVVALVLVPSVLLLLVAAVAAHAGALLPSA
jgi:tight adherence protein C